MLDAIVISATASVVNYLSGLKIYDDAVGVVGHPSQ
jgi:hypothetical protein